MLHKKETKKKGGKLWPQALLSDRLGGAQRKTKGQQAAGGGEEENRIP